MFRFTCIAVLMIASVDVQPCLSAAPPPAASQPVLRSPAPADAAAGKSSSEQLHAEAIQFLRLGQLDKAQVPLEKLAATVPPSRRQRPLVLNRAVLDLSQRIHVMRAVREVAQYLKDHPEMDEEATNLLGAALNLAAYTPRWKQGALWQSAFREWDKRNEAMDRGRPGFRRWGVQWLTDAQFAQLQQDREALGRDVDAQKQLQAVANERVLSLQLQQARLMQDRQALRSTLNGSTHGARAVIGPNGAAVTGPPRLPPDPAGGPGSVLDGVRVPDGLTIPQSRVVESAEIRAAEHRVAGELISARGDLARETARLSALQRQQAQLGLQWPGRFDPFEATALTAPPLPPPDPEALAAATAKDAKAKAPPPAAWPGFGGPIATPATSTTPTTGAVEPVDRIHFGAPEPTGPPAPQPAPPVAPSSAPSSPQLGKLEPQTHVPFTKPDQ
ncbi:MAG: hypothetical protein ABIP55_09685 [Tepidisphaeraceae bacterium]